MDGGVDCSNGVFGLWFFVTAGRGTESFAAKEIEQKLFPIRLTVRDGKVVFRLPSDGTQDFNRILTLKSVERAFVAITDYDNSCFIQGKRKFLDKLMAELSTKGNFENPALVLKQLSSLLSVSKTNICRLSQTHSAPVSGEINQQQNSPQNEEEICFCQCIKNQIPTKSDTTTADNANVPDYKPAVKLRKLTNSLDNKISSSRDTSEAENKSKFTAAKPETTNKITTPCEKKTEATVDPGICLSTYKDNSCDRHPLTFRMSIKASGKVSRWLNLKKLSKDAGWRVAKASGWTVNLRNPAVEVCVHISDEHVTVGVPLTRFPLSKRNYLVDSGLRAPVAWIMNHLANIQPGDIVLDPMCGKATILMEGFMEIQRANYMGSDIDSSQIEAAEQNLYNLGANGSVSFTKADGLNLPYRDEIVDAVLCDAPFNNKHLISATPETFYHKFLKEIFRVLRSDGHCVLLVSQEMKSMILSLIEGMRTVTVLCEGQTSLFNTVVPQIKTSTRPDNNEKKYFDIISSHYVKLGETHACIIVLNKCTLK